MSESDDRDAHHDRNLRTISRIEDRANPPDEDDEDRDERDSWWMWEGIREIRRHT